MSNKVTGEVWELDLPHNQKFLLLALADHADHEGRNVYPSLALLERKTGYSRTAVKRLMGELKSAGIVLPYSRTQTGVVVYRIETAHVLRSKGFTRVQNRPGSKIDRGQNRPQNHSNSENNVSSSNYGFGSSSEYDESYGEELW